MNVFGDVRRIDGRNELYMVNDAKEYEVFDGEKWVNLDEAMKTTFCVEIGPTFTIYGTSGI